MTIFSFEHNKKTEDKDTLVDEVRRIIRSSIGNRAKEVLVMDFIRETDFDIITNKTDVIAAFYSYAQCKLRNEAISFIKEENLNEEKAKHYITYSLRRGEVSDNGTDLNAILPGKSPLNPGY